MTKPIVALRLRQLLVVTVVLLTVEGVLRKLAPGLGVPIFLMKDVLVMLMAYYIAQATPNPAVGFLWTAYKALIVLFIPVFINTALHDPLLAIFGAKQYLLYPLVAFATVHGFANQRARDILLFYRLMALLIIPTGVFAAIQFRLPTDHWLNMSVSGESLAGFSASGKLRVSSTFSFVAQYCAFLNAMAFIILIALHGWKEQSKFWKLAGLALIPFLVFSCFITGSRTAVAGNLAILLMAGLLALVRFKIRNVVQVSLVAMLLYLSMLAVTYFSPDSTAVYSAREQGKMIGFSSEIQDRIFGSFFVSQDDRLMSFLGYGAGTMSNGAETFSPYAANLRIMGWTETDFSLTLFEGGFYLVLVWYGFRGFVILATTFRFAQGVAEEYVIPMAFTQGFIIVLGAISTLGNQPPIAIWWWFGVGTSILFWWKSQGPKEVDIPTEDLLPALVRRTPGRSLYANALHARKSSGKSSKSP